MQIYKLHSYYYNILFPIEQVYEDESMIHNAVSLGFTL